MAAAASSSTLAPPSANGQPASTGSTKEQFNQALQSRNPENNYIAHLKIWETTDDGQRKARYLILAVQRDTGKVTLNKAKRNANGSFSIGKDWDLNTLREAEVHGVSARDDRSWQERSSK